ncbi:GNAT family N-acetyltransferase [Actinomadura alba]|uniref:GNAT family N-acetyltransferase n=1 Tax=Actinomadura alba TaxID=406431 RepID=A0ABR7LV58_9ACTN|nr:GNAT family N-acetyltransferase [Actinomadura alba]MBC6468740.1 GNAT family N-acetyltransferase [Actinomadura alba]
MTTTAKASTLQTAAFLSRPDAALRATFLEAMAEHHATDGKPDADGLTLADLRTADCVDSYVEGLVEGTALRPGTEPLRPTVWWYVADLPERRHYLGRVSVRHYPATSSLGESGSQLWVTVRPSARREGHGHALLTAALPFARANGITEAVIELDRSNEAARRLIEPAGARPVAHHPAERSGRQRYLLPIGTR